MSPRENGAGGTRDERLGSSMREAHTVCEKHRDVATTSLLGVWIDETERGAWFLFETTRRSDPSHH